MPKIPLLNFNTGEISPILHHRSDLQKYPSAAKRLENFINLPQGGLKRRLGTNVQARIGDTGLGGVRVIPWEVDRDTYFQLVFVDTRVDIYSDQGVLVETVNSIPWSASEFGELYFKQVYDVLFVAHYNHPLKRIERTDTFTWAITDHAFNGGPYGALNTDTSNIFTFTNGSPHTIASVSDSFTSADVGRKIRMIYDSELTLSGDFNSNQSSSSIPAHGEVFFKTEGGTWTGEMIVEISLDGSNWEIIASVRSEGNTNKSLTREINEFGAEVRVTMRDYSTGNCKWTLETESQIWAHFTIDAYNSATSVDVTADSITPTGTYANHLWALGAFGETNGYPSCLEVYEERLMLGGVPGSGATIYGSTINDWNDWQSGSLATSPVQFTLASDIRNTIRWIVPEQQLIVGTNYGEWSVGTRDSNEALSGSNVNARRQVEHGSDAVQPITYADMSLYIEAGGKRIRAAQYNYEKDGYVSADMTILAEHLTSEISDSYPNGYQFKRLAYSRTPDSIIWAVRDDGLLIAFTYEREHQVSAWSRQPFSDDGKVLDINSILHTDGDVVTVVVERADGTYLETMDQGNLCLDWQQNYSGILESDVIALPGNEPFLYYNEDLAKRTEPFSGQGSFIYISATLSNALILKYNGTQLILGSDYAESGTDFYWIPSAIDKSLITAFDFTTQLTVTTDYQTYEYDECYFIDIKNTSYTLSGLTVKRSAVTVAAEEKYVMTGERQILVTNCASALTTDMTIEDGGSPLDVDEYIVRRPRLMLSIYGSPQSEIHVGIKMTSLYKPVDKFNMPDAGGPGTRNRINEVEVYAVDSLGGEVSNNNGEDYESLKYLMNDGKLSIPQEYITGRLIAEVPHGSRTEGDFILRNETPYRQKIAAISFNGRRQADK